MFYLYHYILKQNENGKYNFLKHDVTDILFYLPICNHYVIFSTTPLGVLYR